MAALSDDGKYGLNCGRNVHRISVLNVRLTETAKQALENYQKCKDASSSQPTIQFEGLQGRIKIPKADESGGSHTFDFSLSNVGKDNAQGSFECIQQVTSRSGVSQLSTLGTVQDKITVCTTNESYLRTRECMAQAKEDTSKKNSDVFPPAGLFKGKTVPTDKPAPSAPDLVPERKRSTPINSANTTQKCLTSNPVSQRPYRDRIIHLLALRSYKKLEVLFRLQRDGIRQKERKSLGSTLHQVANLNIKDNSFSLKEYIYREVQRDWPGYSEDERIQLDRILAHKLSLSTDSSSSTCKEPASSLPKCQPEVNYIDPLRLKKPRISHFHNRGPLSSTERRSSSDAEKRAAPPVTGNATERKGDRGRYGVSPSEDERPKKRRRSETQEKCVPATIRSPPSDVEPHSEDMTSKFDINDLSMPVVPDYIAKYTVVVSMDQRQRYTDDFNAEYNEYRVLHAKVESRMNRFKLLDSQYRRLQPGTEEYQMVLDEVLQEYKQVKQHNYHEEKQRCEYLHNKLTHIKRLTEDFDRWMALF